jgi:hypothetical protein
MAPLGKEIIWLISGLCLFWVTPVWADWEREVGLRAGYESNLDRAVSNPQGSGYGSGYVSLNREPDGEARLDWLLWSQVEGTAYFSMPDLNGAVITVAPGMTYVPHKDWLVTIAPFVQAKTVVDSEQSAFTWGGKLNLKQRWGEGIYTGQYYVYKDSRAQVDTYSYTENTLGLFLGVKWAAKLFAEIGYEFSRGDSFLTIDHRGPSNPAAGSGGGSGAGRGRGTGGGAGPGSGNGNSGGSGNSGSGGGSAGGPGNGSGPGGGTGRGSANVWRQEKGPHYSSAFGSNVVRENVTRQAVGVTLGIDWTKAIYSLAGYTYTNLQGDSGTAANHAVFISTGYRF